MGVDSVIQALKGKNIHVVGLAGTEGAAVVDFLVGRGVTGITAHDVHRPAGLAAESTLTHQWLPPDQHLPASPRVPSHPLQTTCADRDLDGLDQAGASALPDAWL